jgi:hypothetical protein
VLAHHRQAERGGDEMRNRHRRNGQLHVDAQRKNGCEEAADPESGDRGNRSGSNGCRGE